MAQARRNRKNKTPAWVWLVIGILLGFFFSHVDFFQAYRFLEASIEKNQKSPKETITHHAQKEETKFDFYNILSEKPSAQEEKLDLDEPKPRPDKKTLSASRERTQEVSDLDAATQTRLPSMEKQLVTELPPLSKQEKAKPVQEKAPLAELPPSKASLEEEKSKQPEKYTLQIAALRSYAEADRLKAQLLLLGFQGIQVKKIAKNQAIWFRVTLGDYSNRKDAESAKKRLKQNNVNGFIIPK